MKIEIILDIILILIGLYLALFKSYFQEKGKNIATSEDIENLTEKVESVKSSFNEKMEYLKSDLNFKNQNRISVKAYEREALLNINEKYAEWLNALMNLSFSVLTIKNYNQLEVYFSELKKCKIEYENAEAKLHIFMHDEELMRVKGDCYKVTLNLEYIAKQATNKLVTEFQIMDIHFSNNIPKNKEETEIRTKEYEKALMNVGNVINDFYNDRNNLFEKLHPKRVLFVRLLQKRLLEIMN
ncbi:hypothetical protein [Flavobacterium sp. CAU 1735]|uniref:hypothetical protein n=1 Tax=Flavobacterium sp. CAU 1735 TaxID=3140361 RepID=UPI003260B226